MVTTAVATVEERVRRALTGVMDPEIPTCSIADLGMIERVAILDDVVDVALLPTFVGCPAKDVIREDAERAVRDVAADRDVRVRFVYDPPWTTDRITEAGRAALRVYGISPHWEGGPPRPVVVPLLRREEVRCPYCGSTETAMESAFGPTPCRAQHFCSACRNPFE
ncbi:MAG: phenylacetate-CoA oxygenase subunit PaaJ, partial [Actinomycetota bacterium]|nr:phenylacetate-CoA oxygenase subunit PaaJ [Actinomycetota bacterium]